MIKIGIYKITNPRGKIYIGQSINIEKRWKAYHAMHCKNQVKLYNSLKNYGPENHIFEILAECNIQVLNWLEKYYQLKFNCLTNEAGLNIREVNEFKSSGKHSEETKQKMREKALGRTHTQETKEKMRITNKNKFSFSKYKLSLNLETGVFYDKIKDAAFSINKRENFLSRKLAGTRKNNTKFILV